MKTCSKCNETKTLEDFYKRAEGTWRRECKKCIIKTSKVNHNKNKAINNEASRKYRAANRAKRNALKMKYIASKNKATVSWADLEAVEFRYHAAKIIESVYGTKWHVDHIIPLQHDKVCGLHVENNLQILPANLNQIKSNKFEVS